MLLLCPRCLLVALLLLRLLYLARPAPPAAPTLSACLVLKAVSAHDVADLREWLDYHLALGVSHVYIMDQNSTVALLHHIRDYNASVTYDFVPSSHADPQHHYQLECFQACIDRHRSKHDFMAFIDVDEFIVVVRPGEALLSILQRHQAYGGLTLNWMLYGSSGHVKRPALPVLQAYSNCRESFMIKSIVNLRHVDSSGGMGNGTVRWSPHTFNYAPGYYAVDTRGVPVTLAATHPPSPHVEKRFINPENWIWVGQPPSYLFELAYLAHFILKSKEDFSLPNVRAANVSGYQRPEKFFEQMDRHIKYNCGPVRPAPAAPAGESVNNASAFNSSTHSSPPLHRAHPLRVGSQGTHGGAQNFQVSPPR